jgi:uncharacterized membrane protein
MKNIKGRYMPTKYKILLTLLILIIGITVILYDNPDLSRKYVIYDYYLLSRSLFISKYLNVPIIFLIQILMIIGLWIFPEAKGKVSIKDIKDDK